MTIKDAMMIFFSVLPAQLPVLLVSAVGLYFALSRKASAPRAFRSAAWGFSLLMANVFVGTAIQVAMIRIRMNMQMQGPTAAYIWPNIMSVAATLLYIAGLILLARAIFLDRKPGAT